MANFRVRKIVSRRPGSLPPDTGEDRSGGEGFVAVGFIMIHAVPALAQGGERLIEAQTCPALVAQRAVLGQAMPRVIRKHLGKLELRGRIKFLLRDMEHGSRNAR